MTRSKQDRLLLAALGIATAGAAVGYLLWIWRWNRNYDRQERVR